MEPWDQLDERKKELQAWKVEQAAEAKARQERQAQEQQTVSARLALTLRRTRAPEITGSLLEVLDVLQLKARFDDGGIAGSLLSLSDPVVTSAPAPRLKARQGDRGPATSRKENPDYPEYERTAQERWERRRRHQVGSSLRLQL